MEQTLSIDPAVEAHVVVRYDPGCPGECFLSYRSVDGRAVLCITFGVLIPRHAALMQARAMVAPYYRAIRQRCRRDHRAARQLWTRTWTDAGWCRRV